MSVCRWASMNLMPVPFGFMRAAPPRRRDPSRRADAAGRSPSARWRRPTTSRAERARAVPAPAVVDEGGHGGAGGRPDEAGRHVEGVDPVARLRLQPVDLALVADVDAGRAHVEDEDAGEQRGEVVAAEPEEAEAGEHRRAGHAGEPVPPAAVGEAADDRRGERAGRADQAEEADDAVAEAVGRAGEQERQRRPQDAERGERERAVERAAAQHRLAARDVQHGGEQLRVGEAGRLAVARQLDVQEHRLRDHEHGGDDVDGAPARRPRRRGRRTCAPAGCRGGGRS